MLPLESLRNVFVILVVSIVINFVQCDLDPLTSAELQALSKLRPMISKDLYQDYMKNDHYLVRYLRARKLNAEAARDMLLESFAWRKEKGIDNILEEKMEIEKEIRYIINHDLEGRPVGFVKVSDIKVRRLLLGGKYDEFIRFAHKAGEIGMKNIMEAARVTGKNITQGSVVADMSGYSTKDHACLLCIQLYLKVIVRYEKYYPQLGYKAFSVNTPRIFQAVWDIARPLLSEYTRKSISIFGFDSKEWRKAMLEFIADDQIPTYLGGTYIPKYN